MAAELFPDGSRWYLGTALGSAIDASGVTNANPPVVTATSHGLNDGDYVMVHSSWAQIDGMVIRVDDSQTDTFKLEGVDSTDTNVFPATPTLSVQKITTQVEIAKVMNVQNSGGDQQFAQWQYLAERLQRQKPTVKNPVTVTFDVAYDDDMPTYYTEMVKADETAEVRPLRLLMPSGNEIVYAVYIGFNAQPSLTQGQIMVNNAAFTLAAPSFKAYKKIQA
ncbi:phage tail protein [Castellaniella sp.]|uniref:phage tail protein n=1 Tax=Castellaniella sp. TaxID=1955812 RepID=UPI00355D5FBA